MARVHRVVVRCNPWGDIVDNPPSHQVWSVNLRTKEPLVIVTIDREVRVLRIVEVSVCGAPAGEAAGTHGMLTGYIVAWLGDDGQKVLGISNGLHTTAQKIWAGVLSGRAFVVRKTTSDLSVADVATLRVGPFALIPPSVIVKLGQSLYGYESHVCSRSAVRSSVPLLCTHSQGVDRQSCCGTGKG